MGNLLASLVSTTGALRAFDRVLQVTQNNVANASTPGYARQSLQLTALPFEPDRGTTGGVWAGEVRSARDEYAEAAVRRESVTLGGYRQQVASLQGLESVMDISDSSGISGALSRLYQSFSSWSAAPDDAGARQDVIDRAADVASAFRKTAAGVQEQMRSAENQIAATVDRINQMGGELLECNRKARQGSGHDAALDARVNNLLEELSSLADFTSVRHDDGSVTVLLGGEIPLAAGDRQFPLTYSLEQPDDAAPAYPGAPGKAVIRSADGTDVTRLLNKGQAGALLDYRNRVLSGLLGDSGQPGELNRLALSFAGRVNEILSSGSVSDGVPAVTGTPLFSWQAGNDTAAAATLQVADGLTAAGLAAIEPGDPPVANGIPLRLAALASPTDSADRIGSFTYVEYFGVLAGRVGRELSQAQTGQDAQASLLAQAKDLREQSSGVSLDEEAVTLMQFQRAYQANARLVQVLNQLTEEMINMLR